MKKLTTTFILILFVSITNASTQVKDILILNGDTLDLYESPLEQVTDITKKIREKKKSKNLFSCTGCWRGFTAVWTIRDSTLYLKEVIDYETDRNINGIIEQIVGKKFNNGLLKADWVNGYIWCGKDESPPITIGTSYYCHEYKFNLAKGLVIDIKENPCITCEYKDNEKLTEFILTHLDWNKMSTLKDKETNLIAYVTIDITGKILTVDIENPLNTKFRNEFSNVIKEIPCMPIYFNEGRHCKLPQMINIEIDKNSIKKYVRSK